MYLQMRILQICTDYTLSKLSYVFSKSVRLLVHLSLISQLTFYHLKASQVLESQIFLAELMLLQQCDVLCDDTGLYVNLGVDFPRRE